MSPYGINISGEWYEYETKRVAMTLLELDPKNLRVAYKLRDQRKFSPTQEDLIEILLSSTEGKRLRDDIKISKGLREEPIVIPNGQNTFLVLEGNTRVASCIDVGITHIDVKVITNLDEKGRLLLLGANHFRNNKAEWDAYSKGEWLKQALDAGMTFKEIARNNNIKESEAKYYFAAYVLTGQFVKAFSDVEGVKAGRVYQYLYRYARSRKLQARTKADPAFQDTFFSWLAHGGVTDDRVGVFTNKDQVTLLPNVLENPDTYQVFLKEKDFNKAWDLMRAKPEHERVTLDSRVQKLIRVMKRTPKKTIRSEGYQRLLLVLKKEVELVLR